MVIRLVIDLDKLVQVAPKSRWQGKGSVDRGIVMGVASFCGPCVCLGVFLLL
jgi:hypothetical protein